MTIRTKKHRYHLTLRRSSVLTKSVVLASVVLCIIALLTVQGAIRSNEQDTELLRAHAAVLEQSNQDLAQRIAGLGTVQGIRQIAREELGLEDPDITVFRPVQ